MANAGYTIPIGESFGLTIGGGIGIGYNEVDLNRVAGFGVYTNKDSWDLTWQAMAEFSYNVTGGLNVSLGYRYFSVDADQSDVRGGILEAGLIYRW
jgi:opacity protein-like surface antigen